jgi:hypothetical protein
MINTDIKALIVKDKFSLMLGAFLKEWVEMQRKEKEHSVGVSGRGALVRTPVCVYKCMY